MFYTIPEVSSLFLSSFSRLGKAAYLPQTKYNKDKYVLSWSFAWWLFQVLSYPAAIPDFRMEWSKAGPIIHKSVSVVQLFVR